ASRVVVPGPVGVLADVEVREAVAVEVPPGGAGGPGDSGKAGLLRDVHELAALGGVGRIDGFVVEEGDAAPAGDEEVGPAVAVVVPDGAPVAVQPLPLH